MGLHISAPRESQTAPASGRTERRSAQPRGDNNWDGRPPELARPPIAVERIDGRAEEFLAWVVTQRRGLARSWIFRLARSCGRAPIGVAGGVQRV